MTILIAIATVVAVTVGAIGWMYAHRIFSEPDMREAIRPTEMTNPGPQSEPQTTNDLLHIVFTREVGGTNHVIYDGRDLGETSDSWPVVSGNHIAFQRNRDGKEHVIYDGQDLGEGFRIGLDGDHVSFVREVGGRPHVILDGTDFGEVFQGQDYVYSVHGDTVALVRTVAGKPHVFVNGQDQGETSAESAYAGDGGVAFFRNISGKDHVIFNGRDYGEGWQIEGVSAGHVYYSKQGSPVKDGGSWYNDFFRDSEFLGSGQSLTISDDGSHYAIQKPVSIGEESYENRVLYDGRDVGKLGDVLNIYMDGGHFAYYGDMNGERHVIYGGNDMGVGDNVSLSGDHIAFARKVGSEWHVIYDGKDIGVGSYPRILGDDIVVQRSVDGLAHLFLNGSDLGNCGAQAKGSQTDDCWPELARVGFSNTR